MNKIDRIRHFRENYSHLIPDGMVEWLDDRGYFDSPASAKYHGAYKGGLYDHSLNVTEILCTYTELLNLTWQREESPYYIGLFHDLCKMGQYKEIPEGFGYIDKKSQELLGHGEKSIMLLAQQMALTEEEVYCIRYHMGAYNTSDWDQLDVAIKKYPNILYVHNADMYASKILDKDPIKISHNELMELFRKTGKDLAEYEEFRQEYIDEGYVVT